MNTAYFPTPRAVAQSLHRAQIARERGDDGVAEAIYRDLTRSSPSLAVVWRDYGLFLHALGRQDDASDCLQQAVRLAPNDVEMLTATGQIFLDMEQVPLARECLSRAHQLRPRDHDILIPLARATILLQAGERLVDDLEKALSHESDNWKLWLALADCREQMGNRSGALAALNEAVLFAPDGLAWPHLRRGGMALNAQRDEIAEHAYSTLLRIDPDSADARVGLAVVAARAGHFERAETLAREALAANPALYIGWSLLARLRKGPDQEFDAQLEKAIAACNDDPEAIPLYFARGTSLEKLGNHDSAFSVYAKGNLLRHLQRPYDKDRKTTEMRGFLAKMNAESLAGIGRVGLREPAPIFIFGMPRSGTTLVETILASHPDVAAGGEMRYIHDKMRSLVGTRDLTHYSDWLLSLSDVDLRDFALGWQAELNRVRGTARHVTDKMPGNFVWLGLILACFPNARLIHVHRDPRDNCFSCFATDFNEGHNYTYDLDGLGHYHQIYQCTMAHWRRVLGSERIVDVEYEALVAHPEEEVRRLIAAAGLSWHPACLDFHKSRRVVATASLHQVRQPLYSTSIGRWRHFEQHLGPLLEALNAPKPL